MKIFGWDLNKNDPNKVRVNRDLLEAYFTQDSKKNNMRTGFDPYESLGDEEVLIPIYAMPPRVIYEVSEFSDVLRAIHQSLTQEIFRPGYKLEPTTDDPDEQQEETAMKLLKRSNSNGQDIMEVSRSVNLDMEKIDEGYWLLSKNYLWSPENELIAAIPTELTRVDPRVIYLVSDKTGRPGYSPDGKQVLFCLVHRDQSYTNGSTTCPKCGRKLVSAHFRHERYDSSYSGGEAEGNRYYYSGDEIFHKSKYFPSLAYGSSPVLVVWMKVVTLMNQDKYIKDYYAKQRPPRGLLFVNTSNQDSLTKYWQWALDQFKTNPHMIPPIAVENNGGSGNFVNFVDFMRSLDEMQFTETREEYRRVIGSVYQVQPIFQGDLSQSGGLNNEGLQITVTNRGIEFGQGIWNDGFYPWLMRQLGVTDYKLVLEPNEEKDEAADEDIMNKRITNASLMQDMGFDIILKEDGSFDFEPLEVPIEMPESKQPTTSSSNPFPSSTASFTGSPQPTDVNQSKIKSIKKNKNNDHTYIVE